MAYISIHEIEDEIRRQDFLDLCLYQIETHSKEFFSQSTLLKKADLLDDASHLCFNDGKLIFHNVGVNAYHASVAADFIRTKLIDARKSFTLETVMSHPDKIELLRRAQQSGYRTYLYYVATEDPVINISRIRNRVNMGGHAVPEDKIVSRYQRSLDLLIEALKFTHRAYIFDNTSHEHVWLAEITEGRSLEMKVNQMPTWFKKALWDKFKVATDL